MKCRNWQVMRRTPRRDNWPRGKFPGVISLWWSILKKNVLLFLPTVPLAILLQGSGPSAVAAEGDTFTPYVFASMTHDSNLLRLNGAATTSSTADTLRQAGAGLNADWKISRQQILLTAAVNENRFDRFSALNYRGRDLHGTWNWRFAEHFSGDIGYSNNLAIGSFAYQQALVSNLRVQERSFVDGFWSFHPNWQVGVGASRNKLSYPDVTQRFLNREENVWETVAQYLSSTDNKVGIKLRETNGTYPNQPVDFVNMLDSGYLQREVLAFIDWKDGAHNELQGQAGTVQRRHEHFSARDYSDINARGTYSWLASSEVTVNVSGWREIWAYDDLATSYSRNRGLALEPRWMPYSTLTISARFQHEQADFLGDPGILPFMTTRRDTIVTRNFAITYEPAPRYSFKMSIGDDKRDSNESIFSYYSRIASVSATLQL